MTPRFSHILIAFVSGSACLAQNFDKLGKKDMVTVGGGFNYNGIFYQASGIPDRRKPYTWFFNGNLNINILDVSLPFTYSYSNLSSSYTQPFNMAGCAPNYKWAKAYIGYNSMNFSPYTLAGHVFLGGGIELTPGKWKIAGMYGRLKKAAEFDPLAVAGEQMSYRRMGHGAKVGYENNGYGLHVIYFSARDEVESLRFTPPNALVLPEENTVVSINGKTRITKLFSLEAEYALSGVTRNAGSEAGAATQPNKLPLLFSMNATSQFFSAYKGALSFTKSIVTVAVNYEHVQPNYRTLGAYFFNNDLENITVAPSLRLLKGKLNLAANAGYQRNNLDKSKFTTNSRMIGALNMSYMPGTRFSLSGMYSNFTTYTNVRPVTDPYYQQTAADTLSFYQVNQNANASCTYNIPGASLRHSFVLASSYQVSNQKQSSVKQPATTVLNGNFVYNITFIKTKWSSALTFNYNRIDNLAGNTLYMGPGLTLGKSFFKNMVRFSLANIFNQAFSNSTVTALVLSERASLTFTPKVDKKYGKPSLSLSAMYTDKFRTAVQKNSFREFTGMANLNYSF